MRLKVSLPTKTLVDEDVVKVIAEAENGMFCMLPRHTDFVAALAPGVLYFFPAEGEESAGEESFAALDEGVLVKCGSDVFVSALNGIRGTDLGQLQNLIEKSFLQLDESERKARTALARLEAGTLRGFRGLQEKIYG
jgi:F-type H+-transporting ATPase subunit epsilon